MAARGLAVLSALTLTTADLPRGCAFYDAVLGALGWARTAELIDEEEDDADVEAVGWGPPDAPAQVWLVADASPTTGLHVTIVAQSRAEVETFAVAADQHGGQVRDAPRRWVVYRQGEYGATVRDPDGNLVEAVAPE